MNRQTAELLEMTPMLRGVPEADRLCLVPHARVRQYRRGEYMFQEGSPSDRLYLVTSGRVKVCKVTPNGNEMILGIFGVGDPVGAVAVYEGRPFPASAVAIEDITCLTIERTAFFALLEQNPSLVRGLLVSLTKRLMEVTARLSDLTGGRVEQRVARFFLKLAADVGQPVEDGHFIPLRLSRQELADLMGTTIETAIRIMSRWGKEGILRTDASGFTLLSRGALSRVSASSTGRDE